MQGHERQAWNERLLREANRRIEQMTKDLSELGFAREREGCEFFCACGRPDCTEKIRLTVAEFEEVHEQPHRFILCPGHVTPEIERVVEEHGRYVVVEKLPEYQRPDLRRR